MTDAKFSFFKTIQVLPFIKHKCLSVHLPICATTTVKTVKKQNLIKPSMWAYFGHSSHQAYPFFLVLKFRGYLSPGRSPT